jgi:hypothetical protein
MRVSPVLGIKRAACYGPVPYQVSAMKSHSMSRASYAPSERINDEAQGSATVDLTPWSWYVSAAQAVASAE